MQRDARDLPLGTDSADAAARFDQAVEHFLKYHADTMRLVGNSLAADPGFLMAHCLRGYLLLAAANPSQRGQIAAARAAAETAAATATPRERLHLAALTAWERGALDQAFAAWRAILDRDPTDLLALRISDTTYFRNGQTRAILEQADRVAPAWHKDLPGYDCFLCVWAFAHEEVGDTAAAERAVDAALAADRTNYFAHHVKAHVMETEGRPREGRDWLAAQTGHWGQGNNLIHHLWWHRTLMELDLGERDAVLASYNSQIRNLDEPMTRAAPDHYVDLQNAAALLWRLEQLGVTVGDRWQELADKAEARIGETGHLLLLPHLMLALAATGRTAAAERFLTALRAATPTAPAISDVALPVCAAVLAHRHGAHADVVRLLAPRRAEIRLLGGSNAQRDMIAQLLLELGTPIKRTDAGRRTARRGDPNARTAPHATRRLRHGRAVAGLRADRSEARPGGAAPWTPAKGSRPWNPFVGSVPVWGGAAGAGRAGWPAGRGALAPLPAGHPARPAPAAPPHTGTEPPRGPGDDCPLAGVQGGSAPLAFLPADQTGRSPRTVTRKPERVWGQ